MRRKEGQGPEDPLRDGARRAPAAVAVEWEGGRWSYAELDAAADRLAAHVARHAVSPGAAAVEGPAAGDAARPRPGGGAGAPRPPVVAPFLPPEPASVAAIHGVGRTGAALAPLHEGWTAAELAGVLTRLEPTVVLVTPDTTATAEAALSRAGSAATVLPLADVGERSAGRRPGGRAPGTGPSFPEPAAASGAVHTVIATSGTSGRPRLVVLTYGNQRAAARGAIRRLGLRSADRWLASLSFAHVGGLALAIRAAAAGSTLVLRGRFDPARWIDALEEDRISHASFVPTMLRRLLAERGDRPAPARLACLLIGGAATDPSLLRRALERGWPVALTYGLTQAGSQVATAEPARVRRKPGTAGPPLAGTELRFADGEILVRGPTVMPGYWDEPADDLVDGWLRTGDLGRLDEEGDLWVVGRRSARIVTGGVTVDPAEVEGALAAHPEVAEAVVVGIPDPEWGERVVAVVEARARAAGRPAAGPTPEGPGLADALDRHCRERLSASKRPRAFRFVERLPRTPTGKPDRAAVTRSLAQEATSRDARAGSADPLAPPERPADLSPS